MSSRTPEQRTGIAGAVAVLCLVQLVDVLGVTSAVVAIPSMIRGVGATEAYAGPLATAYAMFFGGLLVLGARLGHRYGHRRVLLLGLGGFALAGGVGSAAQAGWQLVAARAGKGATSALCVPAALNLLLATADAPATRARALGLWSAAGAAAGASGLFLGGVLTDTLGWRSVLWINVPLACGLVLGVLGRVHARPQRDPGLAVDVIGATLLTGAVMALVLGAAFLEQPSSRLVGAVTVAAGAVLGALLAAWLPRARSPILPPAALRLPRLAVASLGSFVNTAATSSTAVLLALHLQRVEGWSAVGTGLLLLPLSLSVIPGSAAATTCTRRWGAQRTMVLGLTLLVLGNLVIALTLGHVAGTVLGLALLGTGLGLSSVACNDLGTSLPPAHVATATGALNTAAQLGTALGVAVLVLVAAAGPAGGGLVAATLLAAAATLGSTVVVGRWRSSR